MLEINAGKVEVHCDECGQPIQNIDDGYVVWSDEVPQVGFIHRTRCDSHQKPFSRSLREFIQDLTSDLS